MGCNCKKTYDKFKKYSDGGAEEPSAFEKSMIGKIMYGIGQLFFGIITAALFIVVVIPFLIYLIVCLLFGLSPSVRIINLNKHLRRGKNGKRQELQDKD